MKRGQAVRAGAGRFGVRARLGRFAVFLGCRLGRLRGELGAVAAAHLSAIGPLGASHGLSCESGGGDGVVRIVVDTWPVSAW